MDMLIRFMADYLLIILVLVALYALLAKVPKKNRYDRYTRIVLAGVTAYFCAKIIGNLWQPEPLRPFELLNVPAGASSLGNAGFPSDHALFAMFLTLAVAYGARRPKLTAAMLVMTAIICVGRVLALVHTPLDVIGGVLIACIGALWYLDQRKEQSEIRLAKSSKK